jgi:hypothetical protein
MESVVVLELVNQELLWFELDDSSGTLRKENLCRWKPVPEEW